MRRRSPPGSRRTSPGRPARSSSTLIAGGHSNLTFGVTDADGAQYVLRRPPLGHVLATAHDMGREHRIISALQGTGVPVPPVLGICTDDAVNGAPFYVMAFVDGHHRPRPARTEPSLDDAARRRGPASRSPMTLARDPRRRPRRRRARRPGQARRLHRPPAEALVPASSRRRTSSTSARCRWSTRSTTRWPAASPTQGPAAIVHGDYRLDNCMVDDDGDDRSPSSTGSSAPSATRSPTSGCSRCTGPTAPTPRAPSWHHRPHQPEGVPPPPEVPTAYARGVRT